MAAAARDGNLTAAVEGKLTGVESRLARLEALMEDVATRRDVKKSKNSVLRWVLCTFIAALWLVATVVGAFYGSQ